MKASSSEKQAIITLLTRIYGEIRAIEAAHHLMAGPRDFRPRIEYFHDAVRATSEGSHSDRLKVELLAHDVSHLRHIASSPLSGMSHTHHSPGTQVAVRPITGSGRVEHGAAGNKTADRATRDRLAELYKNYAVLFVALLAEPADRDHKSRLDEMNGQVEDAAVVEQMLSQLASGKMSEQELSAMMDNVMDDEVRRRIFAMIRGGMLKKREQVNEAVKSIKQLMKARDSQIAALEAAHFTYVTTQLALYEESKDLIKKMMREGLNMAGKFLEQAAAQAQIQGRGSRGR